MRCPTESPRLATRSGTLRRNVPRNRRFLVCERIAQRFVNACETALPVDTSVSAKCVVEAGSPALSEAVRPSRAGEFTVSLFQGLGYASEHKWKVSILECGNSRSQHPSNSAENVNHSTFIIGVILRKQELERTTKPNRKYELTVERADQERQDITLFERLDGKRQRIEEGVNRFCSQAYSRRRTVSVCDSRH